MKKSLSILIILSIMINLISVNVSATTIKNEIFHKISIDNGLSNEHVTTIFQDTQGYMWIGTKDGLNRFNGEFIKVYNCSTNNKKTLSSTYITTILEDSSGKIWVGTDDGLDILDKDTDNIMRFKDLEGDISRLGELKITALLISSNEENIIWVGTEDGLMKVDTKSLTIKSVYSSREEENSLSNSYITCLKETSNGEILVGTRYGVNTINEDSKVSYNTINMYNDNGYIYSIEEDKQGMIWVSSKIGIFVYNIEVKDIIWIWDKKGINKYNLETKESNYVATNFKENENYEIEFLLNDKDNNTWISSNNGLVKYSYADKKISFFNKDVQNANSISSNYTTCLYEDRNGTLWIGTEKGVNILSIKNNFTSIDKIYNEDGIKDDNNVVSIVEQDESIWIATRFNGIYIFNKKSGDLIYKIYNDENFSLSDKHIKQLVKIKEKFIACITNKEVIVFDTDKSIVTKYFSSDGYSEEVEYIYGNDDKVWVVSTNRIFCYSIDSGEIIDYNNEIEKYNIKVGSITYIVEDKNDSNILWMGGVNTGILKYDKEQGVIEHYLKNDSEKDYLISNYINCMAFDKSGNLWIGTNIGISKFDIESKKFTSYTTVDGLSNNYINSILIDNNNNLWISTNNGLNKFNVENDEIISFAKMDGITGYQFSLNSSLKTEAGIMIFGSTNGITYFDPSNIEVPKMNEDKVVIGDITVGKNKVIYDGEELVLEYNKKDLFIDFFLPNYENFNNITYEYMIEGIDSEWVYIDSKSHLDLRLLDSGKYTLKIRARAGHGDLTEETILNIRVKNPIWKTPIAYITYITVTILIGMYILNYVKILRKLVEQKTDNLNKQLEEDKRLSEEIINKEKFKNTYFVNLSHELRTPINVISSTVQLINSINKENIMTKENSNRYMNIISRNCNNLLKIINDIIDSSKIETGHYKISKKNNDIVYVVEEAALSMSKYIEEKGLKLIIDPEIEEKIISFDENEIERCVINLLGNAVKFTSEGGEVRVYIKEINNNIEITVEDTGIGISKEDQEFIFNRFSQVEGTGVTKATSSGIGLTLVKYIAKLHNGYVKLESEINKGSRFTIGIPIVVD